jgi:hypothetical protein
MPNYTMIYGDETQTVRQTFRDVDVQREDGWTVLFRGNQAILRLRDAHVHSLELIGNRSEPAPEPPDIDATTEENQPDVTATARSVTSLRNAAS